MKLVIMNPNIQATNVFVFGFLVRLFVVRRSIDGIS